MKSPHWVQQVRDIASDFEEADVKAFRFTKVNGKVTCVVTVLNASNELVMWELVDDDVSADRWRKLASKEFSPEIDENDPILLPNHMVRDVFISALSDTSER